MDHSRDDEQGKGLAPLAAYVARARNKLGAMLIVLGLFVVYRSTLPLWAKEVTGTVTALGAQPADPHMNRTVNVRFVAPDGSEKTTTTYETGDERGKLQLGDAIELYVWPIPPYAASAKEIVAHALRMAHVLLAIWLAVSAAFVGLLIHGRSLERRLQARG